jgi:hypothetical protein
MSTEASSSDQTVAVQEMQAARFNKQVVYVSEPHRFLVCRTCDTAVPLNRITQHFSSAKNHNYERQDGVKLLKPGGTLWLYSCHQAQQRS